MTGVVGIMALGAIITYKVVPKILRAIEIENNRPHVHRHVPIDIVYGDDE